MKFAKVAGFKTEAEKGLSGICQGCEKEMIPICGLKRAWHWRHKLDCECDPWWENETEWHRNWKDNFPVEYQEIRQRAENGEWHIADVKTKQGNVIEFQHSSLNPEERSKRNEFYGANLIWVVDGLKRKTDLPRFFNAWNSSKQISKELPLIQLPLFITDECKLLDEWSNCKGPVFFDFGTDVLLCLMPKSSKGKLYAGPFLKQKFVSLLNENDRGGEGFFELIIVINKIIVEFEKLKEIHQQHKEVSSLVRPAIQRSVQIPNNPSKKQLYFLNYNPRRIGRL